MYPGFRFFGFKVLVFGVYFLRVLLFLSGFLDFGGFDLFGILGSGFEARGSWLIVLDLP